MKQDLYILVAVFVVILVILVWMGFRMIVSLRRTTRKRKARRQEWIERINARKNE
jgi:preprotein translocase subunit YajC